MVKLRMRTKHAYKKLCSCGELVNDIRKEIADILHGQCVFVYRRLLKFGLRFFHKALGGIDRSTKRTTSDDFFREGIQLLRFAPDQNFAEPMMLVPVHHLQ